MMSEQAKLNEREKKIIEAFSKLEINHWGISNEYAEQIVPVIMGKSTIDDFNKQMDIQLAYQEGMFKMFKLLNQNKEDG